MTGIWTVARHMVAEGIRMKLAQVFFVLIVMVVLVLPFSVEGDGSLTGAVQSYLSFSLTGTGFFLGVLTIFLSRSLSDELVNKQLFIVLTKPVPRWQYLLGKWLGISMINAAFLFSSGTAIYGMVHVIKATKTPIEQMYTSPMSLGKSAVLTTSKGEKSNPNFSPDRHKLETEVLVARHASPLILPDFTQAAEELYQQKLEEGFYDGVQDLDPQKERARWRDMFAADWKFVHPLNTRTFHFKNVLCDRSPQSEIQFRYKAEIYDYPRDEIFRSIWQFGDPYKGAKTYQAWPRHVVGHFHTIKVPADCVADDYSLTVHFWNKNPYADPNLYKEGPLEEPTRSTLDIISDKMECLFVVGSFEGNLLRLIVMMMCKLMFLAAVGILMTSIFSYPVACLASFVVYGLAGLRGFLLEAMDLMHMDVQNAWQAFLKFWPALTHGTVAEASSSFQVLVSETMNEIIRLLFYVIPDFNYYDGVETLVDGKNVSLVWVLQSIGELAILQTGIVLGLAMILFYRRELSEVSI